MSEEHTSGLAEWLSREMDQRGWGQRKTERETGVSKGALKNILENPGVIPDTSTLIKLASRFNVPLYRLYDYLGVDLGLPRSPSEVAQRLATLIERNPDYGPIVSHLLNLRPEDVRGVVVFLELLDRQRRNSEGEQPSDGG